MAEVSEPTEKHEHHAGFCHLRTILVLMVIVQHVLINYDGISLPIPKLPSGEVVLWNIAPAFDPSQWTGYYFFFQTTSIFLMPLFFLVSGFFVWNSLKRKGTWKFICNRFTRLGLPFAASVVLVMPLAQIPLYLDHYGYFNLLDHVQRVFAQPVWNSGPSWFLSVLLTFGCLVALWYHFVPRFGYPLARMAAWASKHGFITFALMFVAFSVLYVPLYLTFNEYWGIVGPFFFQQRSILEFFFAFIVGIGLGAYGIRRGALSPTGPIAKRFWFWSALAVGSMVVYCLFSEPLAGTSKPLVGVLQMFLSTSTMFAAIAFFVRFADVPMPFLDSLGKNSYTMFIIHPIFAYWVQFLLVGFVLPDYLKGLFVVFVVLVLCYASSIVLRRIPPLVSRLLVRPV